VASYRQIEIHLSPFEAGVSGSKIKTDAGQNARRSMKMLKLHPQHPVPSAKRIGGGMKNLGPGLPIVERSRHANADCFRIIELKANGHKLRTGAMAIGMAAAVILVLIVLHGGESDWFPWHHSFAEHFRHNKDDEGPKKASASQEID
jgi:hypothetical protein